MALHDLNGDGLNWTACRSVTIDAAGKSRTLERGWVPYAEANGFSLREANGSVTTSLEFFDAEPAPASREDAYSLPWNCRAGVSKDALAPVLAGDYF